MNKFTSTLAGLALVATVSVAPAFAQGNLYSPPGGFTFNAATGVGSGSGDQYNPLATGVPVSASFTLTGTLIVPGVYTLNTLVITPASGPGYTYNSATAGPLTFTYTTGLPNGGSSLVSNGADKVGNTFNLVNPVPEASTVVSFGALLALGGLAVLRRKSVKNAA